LTDFSKFEAVPASEILSWAIETYGGSFAIASSLQKEGMAILDMASRIAPGQVRVFTLDTGRLPDETYQMIETVRKRYGIDFEMVFPAREEVERMVTGHGPNLFYSSPQARLLCCDVRKVRPLARKLRTLRAWATGRENDVPVHPLYARGYTSIGCQPCTRAVGPEEHERAGRWWWEEDAKKECGIHFAADGSVTRNA